MGNVVDPRRRGHRRRRRRSPGVGEPHRALPTEAHVDLGAPRRRRDPVGRRAPRRARPRRAEPARPRGRAHRRRRARRARAAARRVRPDRAVPRRPHPLALPARGSGGCPRGPRRGRRCSTKPWAGGNRHADRLDDAVGGRRAHGRGARSRGRARGRRRAAARDDRRPPRCAAAGRRSSSTAARARDSR